MPDRTPNNTNAPNRKPKCSLCGLTCPSENAAREVFGRRCHFCCPGCHKVYEILANLGDGPPEDFKQTETYRQCVAAGIIPRDQEDLDSRGSTAAGAGEAGPTADANLAMELNLRIEGMWCAACAWLIEQVVGKIPGVVQANVHFLSDTANIRYFPFETGPETISSRIAELGYFPSRFDEGTGNALIQKQMLQRLGIAGILTVNVMMISFALYYGFIETLGKDGIIYLSIPLLLMTAPVVFFCGWPIFRRAAAGVRHLSPTMDTLIAAGALSAFGYSVYHMAENSLHLYFDTAAMLITMVLLGKFIEFHAREKVSAGITSLYRLANRKVRLIDAGGPAERWVTPEAAEAGCRYSVRTGEGVPLDGRVVSGRAVLDLSALTGESVPVNAACGDRLMAGSRLIEGELVCEATATAAESALQRMIGMMQEALCRKNDVELLADRLTRLIVPAVVVLAAGTAVWMLLSGFSADEALLRAVTVLVITCPCALGIATPLAKVAALGIGRSAGILIRDARALEIIEKLDTLVLDKTGTLTRGIFSLKRVLPHGISESRLIGKVAAVEVHSDHFLAKETLRFAAGAGILPVCAESHRYLEGMGILGEAGGETVAAGNRALMAHENVSVPADWEIRAAFHEDNGDTVVFCAIASRFKGLLVFGDSIRKEAPSLISTLKARGYCLWLVSGDSDRTTGAVARELGIDRFAGNALPGDKARIVRRLQSEGKTVGMLGDGINDAAVLAAADVGVAIGAGENLLQEVSDLTIASGDPSLAIGVLDLAALTGRTIRQNLFFAFAYNLLGIPLAMLGYLNPFLAVVAMFASSLTVIGNTFRITRMKTGPGANLN